jgi:hypothetical protein
MRSIGLFGVPGVAGPFSGAKTPRSMRSRSVSQCRSRCSEATDDEDRSRKSPARGGRSGCGKSLFLRCILASSPTARSQHESCCKSRDELAAPAQTLPNPLRGCSYPVEARLCPDRSFSLRSAAARVPVKRLAGELLSANGKELIRRTRAANCKQFERRLQMSSPE